MTVSLEWLLGKCTKEQTETKVTLKEFDDTDWDGFNGANARDGIPWICNEFTVDDLGAILVADSTGIFITIGYSADEEDWIDEGYYQLELPNLSISKLVAESLPDVITGERLKELGFSHTL